MEKSKFKEIIINKKKIRSFNLNRSNSSKLAMYALLGFSAIILLFGILIYKFNDESSITRTISGAIPYPVISVNGSYLSNTVTYSQYLKEVATAKNYVEYLSTENPDINKDTALNEYKDQVFDLFIDQILVKQGLNEYKASVTNDEINMEYDNILVSSQITEPQEAEDLLKEIYGRSIAEYKNKVIKPGLEVKKLAELVSADEEFTKESKDKIDLIKEELNNGSNFEELAKLKSEDATSPNGGDLGFFTVESGLPEIMFTTAFAQEVGGISEVIKTEFGYHILKTLEKDEEGLRVRASHILVESADINDWLMKRKEEADIKYYYTIPKNEVVADDTTTEETEEVEPIE